MSVLFYTLPHCCIVGKLSLSCLCVHHLGVNTTMFAIYKY